MRTLLNDIVLKIKNKYRFNFVQKKGVQQFS